MPESMSGSGGMAGGGLDLGLLQVLMGGGQGNQAGQGGQSLTGLASPAPLSGLMMGDQGQGQSGVAGVPMSGDPSLGGNKQQAQDQQQTIDPLMLTALEAQLMAGMGPGLGNLSLLTGVGGQSLGNYFQGQNQQPLIMSGPSTRSAGTAPGTGSALNDIKSALGGVSTLVKLANILASPTQDERGDTGGTSLSDQVRSQEGAQPTTTPSPTTGDQVPSGQVVGNQTPLSDPSAQAFNQVSGGEFAFGPGTSGTSLASIGPQPVSGTAGGTLGQGVMGQSGAVNSGQVGAPASPLIGQPSGGELGIDFPGSQGANINGLNTGSLSGLLSSLGIQVPENVNLTDLGLGNMNLGTLGSGANALTALLPIIQGLQAGGLHGDLQAASGGLKEIGALAQLFPEATQAILGDYAGYLGPALGAAGLGFTIADRASSGMPADEQATFDAIDTAALAATMFAGPYGMVAMPIAMGLEAALAPLWAKYPSHEQRDTWSEAQAQTDISQIMPALQAAGDYGAIADALTPLFKGRYNDQPYPILNNVGMTSYNMGGEGYQDLPNREQEIALFGGSDPNAISFSWQQGVRPEFNQAVASQLSNDVNQQIALIRMANAGNSFAQTALQNNQQVWAADQARAQLDADRMYRPWLYDPNWLMNFALPPTGAGEPGSSPTGEGGGPSGGGGAGEGP